jgi:hypothetical protein
MTMAEGNVDRKVEQQWMWQLTPALTADKALEGGNIVGCCRRRRMAMAMVTEGDGDQQWRGRPGKVGQR